MNYRLAETFRSGSGDYKIYLLPYLFTNSFIYFLILDTGMVVLSSETNAIVFSSVAVYIFTGIFTKPKPIVPLKNKTHHIFNVYF